MKAMMRKLTTERRGTAAIELAILLAFLMFVFAAGLDYGRIFHATQVLESAASSGAMYASGTAWSPASSGTNVDAARSAALAEGASLNPPLTANQVTVTVVNGVATIIVEYDFEMITGILDSNRIVHLTRTVEVNVAPRPGD
jgi:Flp pilus assembly protein TadG